MPSGLGICFIFKQRLISRLQDATRIPQGEARATPDCKPDPHARLVWGRGKHGEAEAPQPVEFELIPDSPDFVLCRYLLRGSLDRGFSDRPDDSLYSAASCHYDNKTLVLPSRWRGGPVSGHSQQAVTLAFGFPERERIRHDPLCFELLSMIRGTLRQRPWQISSLVTASGWAVVSALREARVTFTWFRVKWIRYLFHVGSSVSMTAGYNFCFS